MGHVSSQEGIAGKSRLVKYFHLARLIRNSQMARISGWSLHTLEPRSKRLETERGWHWRRYAVIVTIVSRLGYNYQVNTGYVG